MAANGLATRDPQPRYARCLLASLFSEAAKKAGSLPCFYEANFSKEPATTSLREVAAASLWLASAAARAVTIIADLLPCFYAVTREAKYRNKSVAALPRW